MHEICWNTGVQDFKVDSISLSDWPGTTYSQHESLFYLTLTQHYRPDVLILPHEKYRKTPNKRPLGGNVQYGVVEGISTSQEFLTEWKSDYY